MKQSQRGMKKDYLKVSFFISRRATIRLNMSINVEYDV